MNPNHQWIEVKIKDGDLVVWTDKKPLTLKGIVDMMFMIEKKFGLKFIADEIFIREQRRLWFGTPKIQPEV